MAILIWIILLLLKTYVITNEAFGLFAEIGGVGLFIYALYNWKNKKPGDTKKAS